MTKEQAIKNFKSEQLLQLAFALGIILLSFILSPPNAGSTCVSLGGVNINIPCTSKLISGCDCPGCGLTRSFTALAHGRFKDSIAYHRLGIPLFVLIAMQIPFRIYLLQKGPEGYTLWVRKFLSYSAAFFGISLIFNWILSLFGI